MLFNPFRRAFFQVYISAMEIIMLTRDISLSLSVSNKIPKTISLSDNFTIPVSATIYISTSNFGKSPKNKTLSYDHHTYWDIMILNYVEPSGVWRRKYCCAKFTLEDHNIDWQFEEYLPDIRNLAHTQCRIETLNKIIIDER